MPRARTLSAHRRRDVGVEMPEVPAAMEDSRRRGSSACTRLLPGMSETACGPSWSPHGVPSGFEHGLDDAFAPGVQRASIACRSATTGNAAAIPPSRSRITRSSARRNVGVVLVGAANFELLCQIAVQSIRFGIDGMPTKITEPW
jgi:hypothetical protein